MTADGTSGSGRAVRIVAAWLVAVLAVVLVMLVTAPAFLVGPGPVISITDGLVVDGVAADEVIDGDFLFTTIQAESVRAIRIFQAAADPERQLVSRSAIVPDGMSDGAFLEVQQEKFQDSVDAAASAVAVVLGVDTPNAEFDGGVVGGPSAGLLIALAIHDTASADDVADGRRISGTGEVEVDGTVTSVGSIGFKVRGAAEEGAQLFLVPSAQVVEARDAVPEGVAMEVLAVDTVDEAVAALLDG